MRLSPLARLMFGLRNEREERGWEILAAAEETVELVLCWLLADDMDRFRFQQSGWSFFCSSARI